MRPIKFKAVRYDDGVVTKVHDDVTAIDHDYEFGAYHARLSNGDWILNVIPVQYTGLKDKNGVEIYEGDIVKYFKKGVSIIEWKNGGFIIKSEMAGAYELLQNRVAELERIGSIYENPELLG